MCDRFAGLEYFSGGINGKCADCQSAYGMDEAELTAQVERGELCDEGGPGRWCDGCGGVLQQNIYSAHAINEGRDLVHLELCEDCYCAACG